MPTTQEETLTLSRATASAAYETMAPDELDAAYDNGKHCRSMLGAWKTKWQGQASQVERDSAPPEMLDMKYGQGGESERIDFLPAISTAENGTPAAAAPTLLYIHGGYWHMDNPKEKNSFIGGALRRVGVNVALVEYGGLPRPEPAPIGEQCTQVLTAIEYVSSALASGRLPGDPSRLVVAGHSAGGHLASVAALHPRTRAKLSGALCISMISDLEALRRHSYFNLSLTAAGRRLIEPEDVTAWSPLALIPSDGPPSARVAAAAAAAEDSAQRLPRIVAAVGGDELPELRRQAAGFHAACARHGHAERVTLLVVEGTTHFDVLDGLAEGAGAGHGEGGGGGAQLFAAACDLLGVSPRG